MAIKISGSTIIDDSRNIVAGVAATFTGNVTIGGTLTYEDVTNVDSVGIVTAQGGIRLAGVVTAISGCSAVKYYGDGSNLTGLAGFSPDDEGNLYAGTEAGNASDADTCYNIALGYRAFKTNAASDCNVILGYNAACAYNSGDGNNIFMGTDAGKEMTGGSSLIAIGYGAAKCGGTSDASIFIGRYAGKHACNSPHGNIFIGDNAGCASSTRGDVTGDNNTAVGGGTFQIFTSASNNAIFGTYAGAKITTGSYNIAFGYKTLCNGNTTGNSNIAIGCEAGKGISSGAENISMGTLALGAGTVTGGCNISLGINAGTNISSGNENVSIGSSTGKCLTTGANNIFVGNEAGLCASWGSDNVVMGQLAGRGIYSGTKNVILGCEAGYGCNGGTVSTYNCNVVLGVKAGACAKNGTDNVFVGTLAGFCHRAGYGNVQIGKCSGKCNLCGCYNTYLGQGAAYTGNGSGNYNVAIGYLARPAAAGDYQLAIGSGDNNWIDGNANFNVGIGTDDPEAAVGVGVTAKLSVGIVSAYQFYGDGSNLTGAGFSQDAQGNLVAGTGAGPASDNTDTIYNVSIGCNAGANLTTGDCNTFIGHNAGRYSTTSGLQVYIGRDAGKMHRDNQHYNIAIGYNAYSTGNNSTSQDNVFIGRHAGKWGIGDSNIAMGLMSASCQTLGDHNIAMGQCALVGSATTTNNQGSHNTAMGYFAGIGLNSAVTANQSARPPTSAASLAIFISPNHQAP